MRVIAQGHSRGLETRYPFKSATTGRTVALREVAGGVQG